MCSFKKHVAFVIFILCLIEKTSGGLYLQLVNSLCDIATRHFTPSNTIVLSHNIPVDNLSASRNIFPDYYTFERVQENSFSELRSVVDLWHMILEEFNKIEEWTLLSFSANDGLEDQVPSNNNDGYVLLSGYHLHKDVMKDIGHHLQKLKHNWGWNPRAKFVILATEISDTDAKMLATDIFAELWMSRVVDSVVLIPTTNKYTTDTVNVLDAYIWFPYHPAGQCPDIKEAVLWDQWVLNNASIGRFLHNASLFPQKIPRDLHGCPLTISTFELPPMVMRKNTIKPDTESITYDKGLEVQILSEFAKSTNSSIKYREAPPDGGQWGWDIGNGTWNGVTGEIARSYSDIGMDCLWYRCHLVKEIECLRPHLIDKVRWYVPCAVPYPRWMSLTRVFKLSLWLSFLGAYVAISVIMWQVVKINSYFSTEAAQNQAYTSLPKCLLNFWAIILEESASNNPPDVVLIRAVFFAWVLYCWAINTVYQTYFTSFLIDPGLQRQLGSEDEILASGIDYNTETSIISLYDELAGTRYKHMNGTDYIDTAEERVSKGTLAFLFSKYLVDYKIAVKYMDANGKPIICEIEEDFAFNFITIFVPKGSPFKTRYDEVLLSIMQAGLVDLWWNSIKYTANLEQASDFNLPPGEYISLTMEHLQSAFYFLFMGYIISVVCFLLELSQFCNHRNHKKK